VLLKYFIRWPVIRYSCDVEPINVLIFMNPHSVPTYHSMKTLSFLASVTLVIGLFSCSRAYHEKAENSPSAAPDSTASSFISSSAAVENGKDSTRKFIRTAELKFKVNSVIKSTYNIEEITARNGGFVTYSNLSSNIDNATTTAVSADSLLETTYFTVNNSMTLRIPNTLLDTTLKQIAANIVYLDYRIIKADDVALLMLSNTLAQKRAARAEERLSKAIDEKSKKLNETTRAEDLLLSRQDMADHARISNLSLADQVNFSTINLNIYQRQTIKRELVATNKDITAYEPGFGKKMVEALKTGWKVLEAIILFLTNLWAVFLVGLAIYLVYRWLKARKAFRNSRNLTKQ
jgi:hypothetical protein